MGCYLFCIFGIGRSGRRGRIRVAKLVPHQHQNRTEHAQSTAQAQQRTDGPVDRIERRKDITLRRSEDNAPCVAPVFNAMKYGCGGGCVGAWYANEGFPPLCDWFDVQGLGCREKEG
jgi:hypothetical protein